MEARQREGSDRPQSPHSEGSQVPSSEMVETLYQQKKIEEESILKQQEQAKLNIQDLERIKASKIDRWRNFSLEIKSQNDVLTHLQVEEERNRIIKEYTESAAKEAAKKYRESKKSVEEQKEELRKKNQTLAEGNQDIQRIEKELTEAKLASEGIALRFNQITTTITQLETKVKQIAEARKREELAVKARAVAEEEERLQNKIKEAAEAQLALQKIKEEKEKLQIESAEEPVKPPVESPKSLSGSSDSSTSSHSDLKEESISEEEIIPPSSMPRLYTGARDWIGKQQPKLQKVFHELQEEVSKNRADDGHKIKKGELDTLVIIYNLMSQGTPVTAEAKTKSNRTPYLEADIEKVYIALTVSKEVLQKLDGLKKKAKTTLISIKETAFSRVDRMLAELTKECPSLVMQKSSLELQHKKNFLEQLKPIEEVVNDVRTRQQPISPVSPTSPTSRAFRAT